MTEKDRFAKVSDRQGAQLLLAIVGFYLVMDPNPLKIKIKRRPVGKRIREEYFEPVTREGVRQFLGF